MIKNKSASKIGRSVLADGPSANGEPGTVSGELLEIKLALILARQQYVRRIRNRCSPLKRHQLTRSFIVYAQGLESIVPNQVPEQLGGLVGSNKMGCRPFQDQFNFRILA